MIFKLCLCVFALACTASSLPLDKERLRFKVSAKGLPDKDDGPGTIDPYVKIFSTESGSKTEKELGKSDVISDSENPDWGTVFEFDFDRTKNQKWHFKVYDSDVVGDDKAGEAWVDVADFVDKGYYVNVNLVKHGYLTIKAADSRVAPSGTPGLLPTAPGTPDSMVLKFKLSANDLKDKDDFGRTDPYVEVYATNGLTGKQVSIGRSGTLTNTKNPSWGDTFEFKWERSKDQRWYFKIYDHDTLQTDDGVGKAWVEVNDYVSKGQVLTVNIVKRGTLTITRADGLPPNPYTPSLAGTQVIPPPSTPNNKQPFKGPAPAVLPPVALPHPHTHGGQTTPANDQPMRIRFKLSGNKLADKDILPGAGHSDPYVRVYITQEGLTETLLKKGTKLSDNENPDWPDIYEFNYDVKKHPKLRFLVLDEDDGTRDDELGDVTMDATEIATKNVVVLKLSEGSITVTRV